MAKVLKAQEIEAEVEEDIGYFYQRLGELRFTPESDVSSHGSQKGYEQRLAVASRHGVAVFADHRGVYIARVHNLLAAATKGEEDQELPPANADEVCLYTMSLADASVALSCDEELLAAWDHQQISVWSLGGLVDRRDTQPLTNWLVPGGIAAKQLAWRPAQAPGTVPEAAVHLESGRHFRTEFDSKEAKDAEGVVTVENLTWSGPHSLLVSANVHPVEALEDEMDIAPLAVVQWAAWDVQAGADPEKLQLTEFIAPGINPHAAAWNSGPYSRTILVPAWGAIVVAHRKASDNHIRLYELGPSGAAKAIDVTEDWSAIRIPTAMDYNDNYVTGLGIDLTSTDVKVQPPDPEASALAPSPVLLVATSDGALRLFTFAHMSKPTEGLVAPAHPFSDALPPMAPDEQEDLSTATTQKAEKRALAVPLPLDDEEDEEGERQETAVSGTAALNIPRTEAGSTPGMFGSSSSPFGTAASASFQSASSNFAESQDSKGFPSLPPQSAQQKAIAKAREAAATKAAAAPAPPSPQAPPSTAPQSKPLAASEHNGAPVPGTSARRNSQQERAVTPVRQKPPESVARLKGESKELAAMEEDFLKTLAETRELEQAFSAAMAKSEGDSASGPGTHQGFHALQKRTNALTRSVADILLSLTTERRRFGELHNGWREDRARAEALLFFNGKHTNGASTNGSVDDSEVLDPALQELMTSIDTQLEGLQKQVTQLNDCLKALEERASTRLPGASSASRASAQQLYNAVNAQSAVATAQLERLEMLWQKLHDMGISKDDDGEESGSGGPPSFPYLSAVSASRPFSPAVDSPTDSSRRTWKQVRKSLLGRPKSRRPAPLLPLSSAAGPVDSPWASASAGSLRRLLLDKVSVDGGGVRLTRVGGTVFPRLPKPDGGEEDWSSPTKGIITDEQPSTVQPAKSAPLDSPFGSSAQVDAGAAAFRPSTQPLKFGHSAGLERAGSSAIALDKIQPQAAPLQQRDGRDATHRTRQPSMLSATSAPETKGKLARKESTASADSSGSTPNVAPRPKHARPSSTQDLPQGPSMGNFKPFQRQASGSGLARAGSAVLGFAEPANSSDSGAESTNKGPAHRTTPPSMQATIPEDAGPAPSAAKMPPVPSKAALAQAQAHAQAALQKAAPTPSAKMPPVPSRAAVEAAQAQGQAALCISGAAPAAKTPPIPDKAAVAAAQAKGQAALQQSAQTPPAAKVPPVPSKAAMAAAQAQGQAALKKTAPAPAAKMPPLPSKAAMAAAHQQAQAALQKSTPAAPGAQTAAATAQSPSPFAIPSASATPAASQAQPVFNFAKLNSGDAASPTASTSATQPFAFTTQQSAASSFASAMSSSASAEAATTASSAAGQSASLFQSVQPSTATSSSFASSPATSQPFLGSFGMSAPSSSAPQPIAPAPSISFGAASAAGFGSTASPAAPPAAFSGFAQSAATPSSPLTANFGSQAPSPSTSAFGTLSFGASASQQMSSPSALASGFGSFGGLGQSTPASASAGSPFNKGISFGTPATPPAPSLFGGFGQPSSGGTANAFAGFSQSASAFGQPQAPMSSAAPSGGAFSGSFGQSTGFGQAQRGGFGQPSPLGTGFGQPAKPGFSQVGSPGFGAPAVPGFGAPATPTFGSPAAPAPPFGAATGSNAFGAAAAQGSGFGAFASMAGQPSPFGAAAQSGGGFAAAAQQSGGFGGFGGGSSFGAPAASSPAASPGNSNMWQMRK
ncbi:hypothetical protein WJX75_004370 [Coccomyxa subellipsoidea]|uniref:Nucleoporin Nup159/Nup146 N-terminal domain-containing protein n=1 Tax=Coccomyxa subellipsoidea TaxID=248742 RepID=A0ABR2YE39_9CHLO